MGTADAGIASRPIVNVATNDTVSGVQATLGSGGNATVSEANAWPTGIALNPSTGAVSTTVAVTAGVYNNLQYQLCERSSPSVCATTTDTVTVINSTIVANATSGTADAGIASRPITNVAATDSVNGAPATLGSGGNATVAEAIAWPTGIALNPSTGAVSTTVAVTAGVYNNLQYKLCDLNLPANCATATDSVTVINSSIVANSQSGTADAGIASRPIANVAATDSVNGAPVVLGSGGNATLAEANTWPTGIALNPSTGAVSTTVAVTAGVYNNLQYKLCDLNLPANCATATDSVTVINSSIVANSQSGTADAGTASLPIANVTATDSVNGAAVVLGSGGNATVSEANAWPTGIALNPGTGAVSTTKAVTAGVYNNLQYQLCDLNAPPNCATATDSVTVLNASIVANPQSGTADAGIASKPIANVAATDTVDGVPAVLGNGGNATVSEANTWPTGIALTPSTGAVSTTKAVLTGVYTDLEYQLCDLNTPANCATASDTVTIITASILANTVNGTAMGGVASKPIANVVASDTVNGAAATLGASGNAKVGQVGAWPAGISLNSSTGAITVAKTVVSPYTYDFQYLLCDLNVPANCASGDVQIVVTSAAVANPDSGTAVAGKASTAVKNVAANDTINGVAARLQTSPNATVVPYGTWPTGISLNTTTGAVTTTTAAVAGLYDQIQYQLCELSNPSICGIGVITITVDSAIGLSTVAGSAVVGAGTNAIGNVVANESVDGVAATLGASGNATIAEANTQNNPWPAGITLDTSTGAISTTAAVAAGSYTLQYQVCDKLTPPNCNTGTLNVLVTQPFAEVLASQYAVGDIEFDWARDGLYCATCNFGMTNSQVNWTDRNNNLWVSGIDHTTGAWVPLSGQETLVDTAAPTAFFWQDWGNGPEWAFSTPVAGQNPISQLVYTGFAANQPATWEYAGAAMATLTAAATWSTSFLPRDYYPLLFNTNLPLASQCPSDPVAFAVFENLATPTAMYTEAVSATASGPTATPFGYFANGIGERFVPCANDTNNPTEGTRWLTFQGDVTIGTNTLQQVFWYDMDTQQVQQLTFDPTTKQRAVLFKAPDFPDAAGNAQYTLMTLAADMEVQIYVQNGSYPNGAPMMQLVNTIYSPDPVEPNMFDPKVFVHCSVAHPQCQSYVVMGLSEQPNSQQTENEPNGLGVASISPTSPMFEILASAESLPPTQRLDPKFFITEQYGPMVYYAKMNALTPTQPYSELGIYYINMQLGAPFGPCVGSSAEEGLNPTWNVSYLSCTAGAIP
jgi:hypothetical protein